MTTTSTQAGSAPYSNKDGVHHNVILGDPEDLRKALLGMRITSEGMVGGVVYGSYALAYLPDLLVMAEKGFVYAPTLPYPRDDESYLLEVFASRTKGDDDGVFFVSMYQPAPQGQEHYMGIPDALIGFNETSSFIFTAAGEAIAKEYKEYLPEYNNFLTYINVKTNNISP
jgi:hypothetical protein